MRTQVDAMHALVLSLLMTVAFLLGGILSPYAAAATTYYVATTGNDANSGTATFPFRTIQKAASVVNPGDTVLVGDGTYTDTNADGVVVYVTRGGAAGSPVTFQSQNPLGAIIDGGYNNTTQGWFIGGNSSGYVVIKNFEIKGGMTAAQVYKGNIIFAGNKIHDVTLNCLFFAQGAGNNEISDNSIYHCGQSGHGHNVYLESDFNRVLRNKLFDSMRYGVHCYNAHTGGHCSNSTIANNEIYNIGLNTAADGGYDAAIVVNGDSNVIFNNLIHDIIGTTNRGIDVNYTSTNTKVYNNTITRVPTGIAIGSSTSGTIAQNNISFNNIANIYSKAVNTTLANNLTIDPKFVNSSADDFHLQSTSPAINAGTTVGAVPTDFDGLSRPQGTAYCVGAYEFKSQSVLTAPSNLQVSSQ